MNKKYDVLEFHKVINELMNLSRLEVTKEKFIDIEILKDKSTNFFFDKLEIVFETNKKANSRIIFSKNNPVFYLKFLNIFPIIYILDGIPVFMYQLRNSSSLSHHTYMCCLYLENSIFYPRHGFEDTIYQFLV